MFLLIWAFIGLVCGCVVMADLYLASKRFSSIDNIEDILLFLWLCVLLGPVLVPVIIYAFGTEFERND